MSESSVGWLDNSNRFVESVRTLDLLRHVVPKQKVQEDLILGGEFELQASEVNRSL